MKNCLLLASDWQLNSRTKLWQSRMSGGAVSSAYLVAFQNDLNSLKRVSESLTVSGAIFKKSDQICMKCHSFSGHDRECTYTKLH